jgi:HAE1 family hydrophobic/amphiphilic exporter-1
MMSSAGVDVKISGSDWDEVMKSADEIQHLMKDVEGITEVSNDSEKGLPEAEIIFNRRALYEQGLNAVSVASEIRALTAGISSTVYIEDGESYDVVLRLAESDRSGIADLERLFVTTAAGERVSVAQIAEIRRSSGPTSISRENQARTVHVVGALADGTSVKAVTAAAEAYLSDNLTPRPGASWTVGGEFSDFQEVGSTMVLVMLMAALLVIAVMVAQFESVRDPLVIVMAMPMMAIGIVLLFFITDTTISMISMMGIIMLMGIVVNNGIVLVDYTRLLRRRGMGVEEAVVESGRTRLRPVLMTTLTTILAMIPMAFFSGEGGAVMAPMGVAVVGGLTTSMLGTLVMVPLFYALLHRRERDDFTTRRMRRRLKKLEAGKIAGTAAGGGIPAFENAFEDAPKETD